MFLKILTYIFLYLKIEESLFKAIVKFIYWEILQKQYILVLKLRFFLLMLDKLLIEG